MLNLIEAVSYENYSSLVKTIYWKGSLYIIMDYLSFRVSSGKRESKIFINSPDSSLFEYHHKRLKCCDHEEQLDFVRMYLRREIEIYKKLKDDWIEKC